MITKIEREREKRGEKERNVLYPMVVTLFVSHFERSLLNTEAPQNAIKRDIKWRVQKMWKSISINIWRVRNILIQNMFYEYKNRKRERKKERDVLPYMVVTLFVSHFERSPLNAEAPRNAIKRDIKRRVH